MNKIKLKWRIFDSSNENIVERYCHNCGKRVVFRDSMKRRQNANGNDIFEFAIYKCEKDHTWNKKIGTFKSNEYEMKEIQKSDIGETEMNEIFLQQLKEVGTKEIEIFLECVEGSFRLDKLLAGQVKDLSRTQIEKLIKNGAILLDEETVKSNAVVKKAQTIRWML